jgi:hypothetical protein
MNKDHIGSVKRMIKILEAVRKAGKNIAQKTS